MKSPRDEIEPLFEDNHLLVVNKPPLWPTQGAAPGQPSVVEWAREYLRHKFHKPGNVYVGVVSRLDSHASGVLVLARTSKAAARLSEQFRERQVDKVYWALVEGVPTPPSGRWVDWLRKNDAAQRVEAAPPGARHAQPAELEYEVLRAAAHHALLRVRLITGRKHQIRAQCALHGRPILGDAKYGAATTFPRGVALHARELTLTHPVRRERQTFEAPPPPSWSEATETLDDE